jgi:hypothetical protein
MTAGSTICFSWRDRMVVIDFDVSYVLEEGVHKDCDFFARCGTKFATHMYWTFFRQDNRKWWGIN